MKSLQSIVMCAALFTFCGCSSKELIRKEVEIAELKMQLILKEHDLEYAEKKADELQRQVQRAQREEDRTKQYVLAAMDELDQRLLIANARLAIQNQKEIRELRSIAGQQMTMQLEGMMQVERLLHPHVPAIAERAGCVSTTEAWPAPTVEPATEWEKWIMFTKGTLVGLGLLENPKTYTEVCH